MGKTYRRSKRYFEDENDDYSYDNRVAYRKEKSQELRKNRPKRNHEDPDLSENEDRVHNR
jgi:hypothetical protein